MKETDKKETKTNKNRKREREKKRRHRCWDIHSVLVFLAHFQFDRQRFRVDSSRRKNTWKCINARWNSILHDSARVAWPQKKAKKERKKKVLMKKEKEKKKTSRRSWLKRSFVSAMIVLEKAAVAPTARVCTVGEWERSDDGEKNPRMEGSIKKEREKREHTKKIKGGGGGVGWVGRKKGSVEDKSKGKWGRKREGVVNGRSSRKEASAQNNTHTHTHTLDSYFSTWILWKNF